MYFQVKNTLKNNYYNIFKHQRLLNFNLKLRKKEEEGDYFPCCYTHLILIIR